MKRASGRVGLSGQVKCGLVMSLGYAFVCIWFQNGPFTSPVVGGSIALFLTLWQLYTYATATETAAIESLQLSREVLTRLDDLENRAAHLRSSFCTEYPSFVRAITSVLRTADSYYNNSRVFHHSGAIPEEADYFKLYNSRARGNTLSQRRLVVLGTAPALQQARQLLQALHGAPRFELRVWTGKFPLDFELILSDLSVVIAFANAVGEPNHCIRIDDIAFAKRMNEFFIAKIWNAAAAQIVKRPGAMTSQELAAARELLDQLAASSATDA